MLLAACLCTVIELHNYNYIKVIYDKFQVTFGYMFKYMS